MELYVPPILVPGTGSDAIWNAFKVHPSFEDLREMTKALFSKAKLVWDLHAIDKHSGNVRLLGDMGLGTRRAHMVQNISSGLSLAPRNGLIIGLRS
jgi:hypothetical protein